MTPNDYKQILARALRELESFSVPEVGSFITEPIAARIDAETGRISPPRHQVRIEANTRHLKPFYDLLTEKYGLRRSEAETVAAAIGHYVGETMKVGSLELTGTGKLYRGSKGLVFEAALDDPTLASYGLASATYPGVLPGKALPTADSVAPKAAAKGSKPIKGQKADATEGASKKLVKKGEEPSKAPAKAAAKPAAKPASKGKGAKQPLSEGQQLKRQLMAQAKAEGRELSLRELAEIEIALENEGEGESELAPKAKSPMAALVRFTLIVLVIVLAITAGLLYLFRDVFFSPPPPPPLPDYERTALLARDSLNKAKADSVATLGQSARLRDSLSREVAPGLGADTARTKRGKVDSLSIEAQQLSEDANNPAGTLYRVIVNNYDTEGEVQNQVARWKSRKGYKPEVLRGGRAGGRYRLQVFASQVAAEARAKLAELKAQGYSDATLITELPKSK
jgi:hypothetical protein